MLEAELDALNKSHALALDDAQAEIEKLRAQLAAQILELKELMDSKLALDAEIATYRRLLMVEETRLREHAGGELQMSGGGGGGGYSMSMSSGGGGGGGMGMSAGGGGGGGGMSMPSGGGGGMGMSAGGGGGGMSMSNGGGGGGGGG